MRFKSARRGVIAFSGLALILAGATHLPFTRNQKAFYAEANLVAFVRPGLAISITSAQVAANGTISVAFTLTDSNGAPLDRTGVNTPGAISLNFIAANIPNGQEQYVDYVTRTATGAASGTVTQAA